MMHGHTYIKFAWNNVDDRYSAYTVLERNQIHLEENKVWIIVVFVYIYYFETIQSYMYIWIPYISNILLVEALCCKPEGRGFDSRWCHCNFPLIISFRQHYGPGVDSASNRNEYQVYL